MLRQFKLWCFVVRGLSELGSVQTSVHHAVRTFFQISEESKSAVVKAYGIDHCTESAMASGQFATAATLAARTRFVIETVPFAHALVPARPSKMVVQALLCIGLTQLVTTTLSWDQTPTYTSLLTTKAIKDIKYHAGCGAIAYMLYAEYGRTKPTPYALGLCEKPLLTSTLAMVVYAERLFQFCRAWDETRRQAILFIQRSQFTHPIPPTTPISTC
jgi:hypothetical protein